MKNRMKNYKVKNKNIKLPLYVTFIIIAILCLSVGYAQIAGIEFTIAGSATALPGTGIFISSALYSSNNGADITSSSINNFSASILNSTVTLGSNASSTITYEITIYNATNDDYVFTGTSYSAPDFYDNTNITFELTNISPGYRLDSQDSTTFYITFKYAGSNTSNPVLHSYISFDFDRFYTITYQNINITNQNYPEYILDSENVKTITFTNDIPYDVSISPTVNYSYNYTTGVLTLNNVKTDIVIDRYYHIIYNLDGGSNPPNQPDKYLHGSTVTLLNPTKSNYSFSGWYDNATFNGTAITNTANKTGDLTLYAKWGGAGTLATTYILGLTNGALNNTTNLITATSDNNTCTNTFAYDGTTTNNLRYVGQTPCNYVKFNCDSNGNCETWRIIGVMNGIDTDPVLKIIQDTLSPNPAQWNSAQNNTWDNSSLKNTLNTTYLQGLNANVADDYIFQAKWYVGGMNPSNSVTAVATASMSAQTANNYSVGIQSFIDFAYATSQADNNGSRSTCLNAAASSYGSTTGCTTNNYLQASKGSAYELTIDRYTNGNNIIYLAPLGNAVRTQPKTANYQYRPAVYLKSNVRIKTDVGDGSQATPYELEPGN